MGNSPSRQYRVFCGSERGRFGGALCEHPGRPDHCTGIRAKLTRTA